MLYQEQRNQVVAFGKKMLQEGLTTGTGGNISIRVAGTDNYAISPSGIEYFKTEAVDVVILDLAGNLVEGDNKPSSEFAMHGLIYQNRPDINAIVHTHSTYASAVSCMNVDLPALHYLVGLAGGNTIRCAKYASYGTVALAENALLAMRNRKAVLLANHGLITADGDIENAFNLAHTVEFCCKLYTLTKAMGNPVILPDDEMAYLIDKFSGYGQIQK